MSSTAICFVHAICKSVSRKKWENFGSLGPIPIIQPPFNSSWVALHYETRLERSFSIEQFPSYMTSEIGKNYCNHAVFLHAFFNILSSI